MPATMNTQVRKLVLFLLDEMQGPVCQMKAQKVRGENNCRKGYYANSSNKNCIRK